ncbi:MAG: hypothetical protein EXR73_13385 [Myxococcales bacterium]|nr:hypothetical protein [Myxococcales bacterium]
MWFIALFGGIALVAAAAQQVRRYEARRERFVRLMSLATLAAIGSGTAADLAAVLIHVAEHPGWSHSPDRTLFLMVGLGESMAPAILGFALLAFVAVLAADARRGAATQRGGRLAPSLQLGITERSPGRRSARR